MKSTKYRRYAPPVSLVCCIKRKVLARIKPGFPENVHIPKNNLRLESIVISQRIRFVFSRDFVVARAVFRCFFRVRPLKKMI